MTAALVRESPPLLEPLRRLEPRIGEVGRAELRAIIAPVAERLGEPLGRDELEGVARPVLAFCKRLYANARSGEALILARGVLFQAALANDPLLERLASIVCGLLAADTGDVVEAVEHFVNALRLVGDDPAEASGIWNNLGLAMSVGGNYDMAGRCFQRAVDLVRGDSDPLFPRYVAFVNLAQSHFHLGSHPDGLVAADRALMEQTDEFRERDLSVALLLRRNLVRLLIAVQRVSEAEHHVIEASRLADRIRTPRALIAASMARSVYELALGNNDVGFTRLESALSSAREVPGALRDTLACMVTAEEAVGNSERALLRLGELSDHVYRDAVEKARENIELASLASAGPMRVDHVHQQARARLIAKVAAPAQPENWSALERLGVNAVMRMDKTGWHGKRVAALSKALAIACGIDPLQALEIGFAAELHDIGTLSVPEEILAKSVLSEAEQAVVRRHTDAGAEILGDDRHPRIFLAREIARYHHAHWDGTGYPERVGGQFIPRAARICAIADAYDELVSGLGASPKTMDEALAELRRDAGRRFDPELVARFDDMVRAESEDLGVDLESASGMEAFQELVNALQEDRGFV